MIPKELEDVIIPTHLLPGTRLIWIIPIDIPLMGYRITLTVEAENAEVAWEEFKKKFWRVLTNGGFAVDKIEDDPT